MEHKITPNEKGRMSIEFEVDDPRGYKVVCTQKIWRYKITKKRPWMNSEEWKNIVIETIKNPSMQIFQDANFENRYVYYRRIENRARYMKVVVAFDNEESGEVITATPVNNGKAGEKPIWP